MSLPKDNPNKSEPMIDDHVDQLSDSLGQVNLKTKEEQRNCKGVQQTYKSKDSFNGSISKLPTCTANGRPSSYKQPSQNYQQAQLGSIDSRQSISNSSGGGGGGGLVPSYVSIVHNSHLAFCPNVRSNNNNVNSNNSAMLETMSVSTTSNRSKSQSIKCGGNDTFRFEEYMPLCEVQRLLGKGEIVEGVLRINQRNFEDAYISAPGGEIDINIYGRSNINRAFNGDRVAVLLNPISKWKIMYDMVDKFWDTWQQEILNHLKQKGDHKQETDVLLDDENNKPSPPLALIEFHKYHNISTTQVEQLTPQDFASFSFANLCLQKSGKVVYVFSQEFRLFGGRIRMQQRNSPFALFSPISSKIPRALISVAQLPVDFLTHPHQYEKCLFLAEILAWPTESRMPFAKLKRNIGQAGLVASETDVLLSENNVDFSPFPDNIADHLPRLDSKGAYDLPANEIARRLDIRKECVFTIDPITARDLDDALSIKRLPQSETTGDEMFEVGVHIADVAHFVNEGDPVDKIAQERTTSFYCVQKVVPMLPHILCQNLCSLNPGEDKFAFSVFWHIDNRGRIVKTWFEKTVMQSCVKLSYELASDFIAEPNKDWDAMRDDLPKVYGQHDYREIVATVNLLKDLATTLRCQRFQNGAIDFKRSQVKFVMDEKFENALGFVCEDRKSCFVVEEFMLLANTSVAQKLFHHYPELAVLRRHDRPDHRLLVDLQNSCRKSDIEIDIESSKSMQQSLTRLRAQLTKPVCEAISFRLLRTMKQAEYFITGGDAGCRTRHFALGIPFYTHFTSPIRRYPDLLVHRQLAAILKRGQAPRLQKDAFQELITLCNAKKMASRCVSETSIKLFLSIYIQNLGSLDLDAVVVSVMDHSFECYISSLGLVQLVYCDQLDLQSFDFNGKQSFLDLKYVDKQDRRISLYDSIRIQVSVPKADEPYKWKAVLTN